MQIKLSNKQVTAVILAGGKGRRLQGSDKGLVPFKQRPMIEHILEMISPQVSNIIINANRNQQTYADYGYPVISDEMSDFQGPLAGFAVAMSKVTTSHILTLPCDGPFISTDYVTRMIEVLNEDQAELAIAHDGERMQPVHALIPVNLLDSLLEFLQTGDRKIDRWYAKHCYTFADFSGTPNIFQNINTESQLQTLSKSTENTEHG